MAWSQVVRQPHFLMLNSMYSVFVGEEVMENIASPTPGMESMAHWPGMCSKTFLPSKPTTRKVLMSGVSMRMSVTTPILGIKVSCIILSPLFCQGLGDLHDVHGDGALGQAPAAAHAPVLALVVGGEVDQLVHEALAEPLQLRKARVSILVKSEYMHESQQRKRVMPLPVLKSRMS